MAGDLNREASELWNSLKPIIDKEIDARTQGMVQRRKAKVTTAPSLATNTIGVTEPFGTEMFLPFNTNIMSASVGDFVWVEYMYGMTNAFVSMFASADDKDQYVAGNLTVDGVLDVTNRRCYAALSSPGWYRILKYSGDNQYAPLGTPSFIIRFGITRHASTVSGEAHEITLTSVYNGSVKFSNEISNSNTLIIDKIRYTYSGNNAYVDIHYNNSGANIVIVDFDVDARLYVKQEIVSQPFTSVGVSPSGETVLTEYTFVGDTNNPRSYGTISIGGRFADIGAWISDNFKARSWVYARVNPTTSGYFGTSSFSILANLSSASYGWATLQSDSAKSIVFGYLTNGTWHWKAPTLTEVTD